MMMRRFSAAVPFLFTVTGCCLLVTNFFAAKVAAAAHGDCVKGIEVDPAEVGNSTDSWSDMFRLTTPNPDDPTQSNKDESADPVLPEELLSAGVQYIYLDPTGYDYPNATKEIPWTPPVGGNNDEILQEIRDEYDYQYADIVVVTEYMDKFFEEHIHAGGDEVRYIIDGSGYFDIRDLNDEWIRMHAKEGDFIVFPAGIEHRFSVDEDLYVQAMRLFPGSGEPDWSSVPRSEILGNNTARNEYVDKYLCGVDPDLMDEHHDSHDHDSHDHEGAEEGDGNADDYEMITDKVPEDHSGAFTPKTSPLFSIALAVIASAVVHPLN